MSLNGKADFLTPLPVAKGTGEIAQDLSIPAGRASRPPPVFSRSSPLPPHLLALPCGPAPVSIRSLAVHVLGEFQIVTSDGCGALASAN